MHLWAISLLNPTPLSYITEVTGLSRMPAAKKTNMDIRISKESELPLRQQLAEQIVFHIATGKLQPGQRCPAFANWRAA